MQISIEILVQSMHFFVEIVLVFVYETLPVEDVGSVRNLEHTAHFGREGSLGVSLGVQRRD